LAQNTSDGDELMLEKNILQSVEKHVYVFCGGRIFDNWEVKKQRRGDNGAVVPLTQMKINDCARR